jgi:hypothetical protein
MAAIEVKGKFVEVGVHVGRGHCTLIDIEQPPVEQYCHSTHTWRGNACRVSFGGTGVNVAVPPFRKALVTYRPTRMHLSTSFHYIAYKADKTVA